MPVVALDAIMETKYVTVINNQTCMTVFHHKLTEKLGDIDVLDATEGFLAFTSSVAAGNLLSTYDACIGGNRVWKSVTAQLIHPTRYIAREAEPAVPASTVSPSLTSNLAAVLTKRTENAARSGIGNMHLPGLPSDQYTGGLIGNGQKTAMGVLATKIMEPIVDLGNGLTWKFAVLNREPIPGTDPVRFRIKGATLVIETDTQDEVRVMRRRTVGVGI